MFCGLPLRSHFSPANWLSLPAYPADSFMPGDSNVTDSAYPMPVPARQKVLPASQSGCRLFLMELAMFLKSSSRLNCILPRRSDGECDQASYQRNCLYD